MPPQEPAPLLLTHGGEYEFIIPYRSLDEEDEESSIFDDELPREYQFRGIKTELKNDEGLAGSMINLEIAEFLKSKALDAQASSLDNDYDDGPPEPAGGATFESKRLGPYTSWNILRDGSISAPNLHQFDRSLRMADVEVTTQILHDSPEAYRIIRYAANALSSKYRIATNMSCGFHVHVGTGASWFDHQVYKRIATLCWAAENILSSLHPPTRMAASYAQPLRSSSYLSRRAHDPPERVPRLAHVEDDDITNCRQYIGRDVRVGERPLLWREAHEEEDTVLAFLRTREPGCSEPFIDDTAPMTELEERDRMNLSNAGLTPPPEPLDSYSFEVEVHRAAAPDRPRIWDKKLDDTETEMHMEKQRVLARRIAPLEPADERREYPRLATYPRLEKLNPNCEKEHLEWIRELYEGYETSYEAERVDFRLGLWPGVNTLCRAKSSCEVGWLLAAQYCGTYRTEPYEDCSSMSDCTEHKILRTIEWRQAAAEIDDPLWVQTWHQIAVGVTRFAIQASVSDYLRVLSLCEKFDEGGPYDVIDFLEEVGLVAEALVAAKRLRKYEAEWKLSFADGRGDNDDDDDDDDDDDSNDSSNKGSPKKKRKLDGGSEEKQEGDGDAMEVNDDGTAGQEGEEMDIDADESGLTVIHHDVSQVSEQSGEDQEGEEMDVDADDSGLTVIHHDVSEVSEQSEEGQEGFQHELSELREESEDEDEDDQVM